MTEDRKAATLFGALVADAAALGLHWIYDPARIASVADEYGSAAFVPIDPANFAGVPAYFAHGARCDGMQSQYGEVLRLMIQSLLDHDGLDVVAYSATFAAHFGAGGPYQGYIDRPTRGMLDNTATETEVTGIDDDQLPAISTLPAIAVCYDGAAQAEKSAAARAVTHVNDEADRYAGVCAQVLNAVLVGSSVQAALEAAADAANGDVKTALVAALTTDEADSVAYGAVTQRACHLPMAIPLSFHILARSRSYGEAVERNIRAGGDSCGRALFIGAVMGAAQGVSGIPLEWVLALDDGAAVWTSCQDLAAG